MKKAFGIAMIALVILSILTGCATTFKAGDGKLSYGEMKGTPKGTFDARRTYLYLIHPNFVAFSKPYENLDNIIVPELSRVGADAATKIEVTDGFTFIDMLLTGITGGFLGFRYVQVKGTALKQ